MSETAKYRHLVVDYCKGNGIDIGSGGDPVVPWAISVDLPSVDYERYNAGKKPENAIHWRGDARRLPFTAHQLDFIFSSHLIEDFSSGEQRALITDWKPLVKPGGYMILIAPDKDLWTTAVRNGQPPNCAHKHELRVGELSRMFTGAWTIIRDSRTDLFPGDYSILFIAQKAK